MKKQLLSLIILFFLSSCARQIALQEAFLLEDYKNTSSLENRVEVSTLYVGDAIDYITFQVDVVNDSNESIGIDARDIELYYEGSGRRQIAARPMYKDEIIDYLYLEQKNVERNRKSETTQNAIFAGLDILGGIVSGASTAETLLYGGSYAADIVDRSNRLKDVELTIEEQIEYHEIYSLNRDVIRSGEAGSYDIHFETPLIKGDATLEILVGGKVYKFDYELSVRKERLR